MLARALVALLIFSLRLLLRIQDSQRVQCVEVSLRARRFSVVQMLVAPWLISTSSKTKIRWMQQLKDWFTVWTLWPIFLKLIQSLETTSRRFKEILKRKMPMASSCRLRIKPSEKDLSSSKASWRTIARTMTSWSRLRSRPSWRKAIQNMVNLVEEVPSWTSRRRSPPSMKYTPSWFNSGTKIVLLKEGSSSWRTRTSAWHNKTLARICTRQSLVERILNLGGLISTWASSQYIEQSSQPMWVERFLARWVLQQAPIQKRKCK